MKRAWRGSGLLWGWAGRVLAAVALASGLSFVPAASALRLDLVPDTATIGLPGSIDLDLVLSGLGAEQQVVSSFDIALSYNPMIVSATAVTFGSSLGGPGDSFPSSDLTTLGTIALSEISLLTDAELDALQGDLVTLATLSFSASGLGTSSIQFLTALLTGAEDPSNPGTPVTLDPSLGGARITVIPAAVPEPASYLLLGLALALAAGQRRRGRSPPPARSRSPH